MPLTNAERQLQQHWEAVGADEGAILARRYIDDMRVDIRSSISGLLSNNPRDRMISMIGRLRGWARGLVDDPETASYFREGAEGFERLLDTVQPARSRGNETDKASPKNPYTPIKFKEPTKAVVQTFLKHGSAASKSTMTGRMMQWLGGRVLSDYPAPGAAQAATPAAQSKEEAKKEGEAKDAAKKEEPKKEEKAK